ncbi:MAG: PadR family transcriptional regulator [Candidatus Limnocylindrales bacterium]
MLLLIAEGPIHGYSVISQLDELGLTADGVDVGMVYRTLRELEAEDLVKTKWGLAEGPPRREYRLTAKGHDVLDEWVAVMTERGRLVEAFLARSRVIRRPRGA